MAALTWSVLFLVLLGNVRVNGSPWIFEKIKPISDSDTVKKSSVPEKPVQEIDPTKTLVDIKQDIRSHIFRSNGTSFKYKEGVKKLLDFLGAAGPAEDSKLKEDKPTNITQGDQQKSDHQPSNGDAKTFLQIDKSHSNDQTISHVNVSKGKNTTLLSNVSGLVNNDGLVTKATESSQPRPVAMGTQVPLVSSTNEAHTPSFLPQQQQQQPQPQQQQQQQQHPQQRQQQQPQPQQQQQKQNVFTKNNIPYFGIKNDVAMSQLSQQTGVRKSYIPYSAPVSNVPKYKPYNPYMGYQKSSLPYGWYNSNRYNVPQTSLLTQRQQMSPHYPYQQPLMTRPLMTRSKIPTYRRPYDPINSYIPKPNLSLYRRPSTFKKAAGLSRPPALMRFSTISNARAPIFQHAQIAHVPLYRQPLRWSSVPHGLGYRGLRYRRIAVTDRGGRYNGLQSPREKVAQKSPLPLPLASIMTAARIVVPARPNTLNGASKSNVETIQPDNAEQQNARAV